VSGTDQIANAMPCADVSVSRSMSPLSMRGMGIKICLHFLVEEIYL